MAKAQPAALDPGMTLVEHLTELRKRLIISVMAVAICMLIACRYVSRAASISRSHGSAISAYASRRLRIARLTNAATAACSRWPAGSGPFAIASMTSTSRCETVDSTSTQSSAFEGK